jgi:hypothetical protein
MVKLNGFTNRRRRIKNKKRMKMARKYVSKSFKLFFIFIFFFFLNKFNIIIDSYKKKFNLTYLFQIYKNSRKKQFKYKNKKNNFHSSKYKYNYIFRYKSKKIYKKRKLKKYGYLYNPSFISNSIKHNMNFLFFY